MKPGGGNKQQQTIEKPDKSNETKGGGEMEKPDRSNETKGGGGGNGKT